jgi:hypothetical protein
MKSNILIKVCSFGVALLLGCLALFYGPKVVASEPVECHTKVCYVNNNFCVCCLIVDGSMSCSPCGGMDCN